MNIVMKTYTYTKTMTFVVMFLIATMVAGCREGFDFEEARGEKYFEDKKIEYIEAFEDAFCNGVQINPDHTWGFGEMMSEEDLMRQAMTRSANCNSNEWANTYIVPSAVTEEEREVVYNFFKTYSNTLESESFNYSEFFVQQVWHGTDVYKDGYGNNVVGGEKMNQLMAGGEHVNNFNGANGDIMLMVNSNTRSFGYWNSCDGKQHSGTNEYKILYVVGYGWYLGFDFMANGQNKNEQVAGDGVYTDWIIKVTPGVSKETKRILCEDLGSIGDFDYNDAVFDVNYISDTKARITLRAAGARKRTKYWFEKLDIMSWWDKKLSELSKGMGQKVQFVVTVIHEPSLLIFDEPFSGFDPVNAQLIANEILELRDKGTTIIFSTHRMESVEEMCDHVALINKSNKVLDGKIEEVRNEFKSGEFNVAIQQISSDHLQLLANKYQLKDVFTVGDSTSFNLLIDKSISSNTILKELIEMGQINQFKEVIPSMNDVFLQAVKQSNSVLNQ